MLFSALASLCQLASGEINDRLLDFGLLTFVTTQISPPDQLVKQGNALIDLFISTTTTKFLNSLQTVRDTTQANALISGYKTSMLFRWSYSQPNSLSDNSDFYILWHGLCLPQWPHVCWTNISIYFWWSCTCLTWSWIIYWLLCNWGNNEVKSCPIWYFQSFNRWAACYKLDSIVSTSASFTTTALDIDLPSQYNITTPISVIVENMMTESWDTNVNYSAYYEQCRSCRM